MALERIAASATRLNAVVALDAEAARAAAAESDRRIRAGLARALEGLPVTVKDCFDLRGLPNTAGSPQWRDRVPVEDAPAVARLRAAGAVILGKTNVSEMLGDLQCANPVHGATRNPHDLARTPGGSSGGSAAAIAAGLSCLDLGSDLCGSIRWPAHCCGVFGWKPGWGSVPMDGHVPPPPGMTNDTPMSTGGLLARSAADLALGRAVLVGPGAGAPPLTGMRIAVWADDAASPVAVPVRAAVRRAAGLLEGLGARVDQAARPFGFADAWIPFGLMSHAILALGLPPALRAELAATAPGMDPADPSHAALRARAIALGPAAIEPLRNTARAAWARFFETHDALLCPPANVPAIPHDLAGAPFDRRIAVDGAVRPYLDLMHWSAPASVADLPAVVAPVELTPEGLPLGVQIIAARGADDTAIAIAAALEAAGCRAPVPT